MYCQVCGALNSDDAEYCSRCQQKLLVLSGSASADSAAFEDSVEENFSFDEHLLERISILEEVVKRTGETVRNILAALHKQEENILINHSGLATLRELLEQKKLIGRQEWTELWETKMEYQLLALEKRERFVASRDRMAALYQGEKRKLFHQYLEEAEYSFFSLNLDKALSALEAAFKLDRRNYELAHFLAETLFNDGESDRALEYFQRVLEVKPDHYVGLVYAGVILHEQGKSAEAEELLTRAVSLYPDAFLPRFSLGAVHAGEGNLDEAVASLERAVRIDSVPQAHYLLGSCFYEMNRLAPAIEHLREAVRGDPGFEDAHHLLGLAYLDRQWHRKALEAFRQAQQLNPKKLRYEDVVRSLSGQEGFHLPEVGEEVAALMVQAEELSSRGDDKRTLNCYRRALSLEPDNPTLLMSYALACLHLNRTHEIEILARKVLSLDVGEMVKATAYATLIEALRGEGRLREGNRIGRRLLKEGTSSFSKSIAYYEMAYNLAEMDENLDQALEFAQRSLELAPEELKQFPLAALGWVHYKREEYDQAIDFLSKATELGASATTLTHLGMALLASGDKERARSALAQARRLTDRGGALEEKMMEFMRDSARLLERVQKGQRK